MKLQNKILLIIVLMLTVATAKAQCGFTVSASSVCAGDEVVVKLDTPYAKYHNIVVYKGTFPFGNVANSPIDYEVVAPYMLTENEVRLVFNGASTAQNYTIVLTRSNSNPNPIFPSDACGNTRQITVNPSPDASMSETRNFLYCSASGNQTISVTNTSRTTAQNTNYTIDWGDGSPAFNSATFTNTTHSYAPGNYVLTYTVTGSFAAPCNRSVKKIPVVIGATAPNYGINSAPTSLCAPALYEQNINTAVTALNSPDTYYKYYVNGELVATYSQATLPNKFTYLLDKGSCDLASTCNGQSNVYSILVKAQNQCNVNPISNCIAVKDSLRPIIFGKDTVCVNLRENFINSDPRSKVYKVSGCEKAPQTWYITPNTGFTVTNSNMNGTLGKQDLQVTFTQKGTYTIRLYAEGDCNNEDTTFKVVVTDQVDANATFPSSSCIPASGFLDIPFTNTSTDPADIRSYSWSVSPTLGTSFIAGSATSKDVTIRFTRSGNYSVTLTATGGCNTDVWTGNVVIKGKPAIDTITIPEACSVPHTLFPRNYFTYTNGGDAGATFNWTFPGATPASSSNELPGSVVYNTPGTYLVTLTISAQCGDSTLSNVIKINSFAKPDAGPDISVCKTGAPITMSATPPGGEWRGNGITNATTGIFDPSRVVPGIHNIVYVLNPAGLCPTYDTVSINVLEINGLTGGPEQTVCKSTQPLTLISNPSFPGGTWFGQGVVNGVTGIFDPVGLAPGDYQVGYVYSDNSGACSDTAFKKVIVLDSVFIGPPPTLCAGQPFDFGTISGNIAVATWKFGDGSPDAIVVNPIKSYASPGTYTVTLIAETPDRCKDTIRFPVNVVKNEDLSFLVDQDSSCTGNNFTFTFPATHKPTTNYIWDFGLTTVQANAPNTQVYSFPKPLLADTTYIITLRADYSCGAVYYKDSVKVKASPKADFTVQPIGCSPLKPILYNGSYGNPTSYFWDFGNGQTTIQANPVAPTYTNTTRRDTVFTIRLKVSNSCGSDSMQKTVTVKANNVETDIFSGTTRGCQPLTVDFYNVSTPGTSLTWDFGDGNVSYVDQPVHTFQNAGVFNVKLLAEGSCGRDSAFTTITVSPTPKVNFTVSNACANIATQFLNQTTSANSYSWSFGDGTRSSLINPTHTYSAVGSYVVKLVAGNSSGCVDSLERPIGVFPKPKAAFTVENPGVCEQQPTILINNTVDGAEYTWYFGNGDVANVPLPAYTYQQAGTYTITLVARNGSCSDSIVRPAVVQIYPKPIADFIYSVSSLGFDAPVEFTNTTVNGNFYIWSFGDSDTSRERDPVHQYDGVGPYRVTLYAESNRGCKDTVSKAIGVDYEGTLYVPNVFSPEVGVGESAIFKPKGLSLKEYQLQIFSTYGQLLFESTALENGQPAEGWDGRYKGTILPQDVYVWKIRAIFYNGKAWEGVTDEKTGKKSVMGAVLLLR